MGSLSIWHWLIIAGLFVMFFGAKRMPDAARGLGRSLRIFKSEVGQMQNENSTAGATPPAQQPAPELAAGQQVNTSPVAPPTATPQAEPKSL